MPNTETQKTTNPKTEDPLSTTIRWDLQGHRIDLTALTDNDCIELDTLKLDGDALTHLRGTIIVRGGVEIRHCPNLASIHHIKADRSVRIECCPKLTQIDALETKKNVYVYETGVRQITDTWCVGGNLIAENNADLEAVTEPVVGGVASFNYSRNLKSVAGHFSDILFVEECGLESLTATAHQIVGINAEEEASLRASAQFLLKQTRRFSADKFDDIANLKQLSEKNSYPDTVSVMSHTQKVSKTSKTLRFWAAVGQLIQSAVKVVMHSPVYAKRHQTDRQRT